MISGLWARYLSHQSRLGIFGTNTILRTIFVHVHTTRNKHKLNVCASYRSQYLSSLLLPIRQIFSSHRSIAETETSQIIFLLICLSELCHFSLKTFRRHMACDKSWSKFDFGDHGVKLSDSFVMIISPLTMNGIRPTAGLQ